MNDTKEFREFKKSADYNKSVEDLYDEMVIEAGGKPDGYFSLNGYIWNFNYLED